MSILDNDFASHIEDRFELSNFLPEYCNNNLSYWERRYRTSVARACGYHRYPDLYKNLRRQFIGPEFVQVIKNDGDPGVIRIDACTQVLDAFYNIIRVNKNQLMDPLGYNAYTKLYSTIGYDTYVRRTILLKDGPGHKIALIVYAMISDTTCPRLELKLYDYFRAEDRWSSEAQIAIPLWYKQQKLWQEDEK